MRTMIACLLTACAAAGSAAAAADRPNVLFLICDDLNCDLGAYGHRLVKSPNIDQLAARGVRFERAYCQYPLCGPSRASFMSGLYPDQTLIHRNAVRIRERIPNVATLSQRFMQQGYEAVRVGKIYHYNVPADIGTDGHDDSESWTRKFNPIGRDKADESKVFSLVPGRYGGTLSWLAADGEDSEQTDGIAAARAVELLQDFAARDQPFFLAVGLYRPHTPYVAPRAWFDRYPLDQIQVPTTPEGYLQTLPLPAQQSLTRKKDQVNLDPELARQAIQAYYASISFADAQVGLVLDALRRLKLNENTIVVFTSDHGYHMGEHGYYQKTTLFENAARVPLVIAAPGRPANGASAGGPVEMVDLLPTLADLCHLPESMPVSGVSLAPMLQDASSAVREDALTQFATGYSLRTPRYRFTQWGLDGKDGFELYDHERDPAEMQNLAAAPAEAATVERLAERLKRRIAAAHIAPAGLKQIPEPPRKPRQPRK